MIGWLPQIIRQANNAAVQLGAAGATVYVTGRTTRSHRSEMNRPETIEETAELVTRLGGIAPARVFNTLSAFVL